MSSMGNKFFFLSFYQISSEFWTVRVRSWQNIVLDLKQQWKWITISLIKIMGYKTGLQTYSGLYSCYTLISHLTLVIKLKTGSGKLHCIHNETGVQLTVDMAFQKHKIYLDILVTGLSCITYRAGLAFLESQARSREGAPVYTLTPKMR